MKMAMTLVLAGVAICFEASARPKASWTPPPSRFTEYEWTNATPSWAKTGNERGGTVVWFYKEMTQAEALPVLLRALDNGETWLQVKAVESIARLTVDLPPDFLAKVEKWYVSIAMTAYSPGQGELSSEQDDRLFLKFALARLIFRLDSTKGKELLSKLDNDDHSPFIRAMAREYLKQLTAPEMAEQSLPPVSGTRGTPAACAPVAPGIPER